MCTKIKNILFKKILNGKVLNNHSQNPIQYLSKIQDFIKSIQSIEKVFKIMVQSQNPIQYNSMRNFNEYHQLA